MQAENKYYTVTPLYKSPLLSKQFNVEVNYKMECYQPSGSFKVRGMDDYHRRNLLKKYFNLSQVISKREPFGMWRPRRSVHGKNFTPCFPSKNVKPGRNLARTYPKQKGSTLFTA